MNHTEVKDLFIDYVEGTLEDSVKAHIEKHLESCEECRDSLREYRGLVELEMAIAGEVHNVGEKLSDGIMEKVMKQKGEIRRFSVMTRKLIVPVATVATACLAVFLTITNVDQAGPYVAPKKKAEKVFSSVGNAIQDVTTVPNAVKEKTLKADRQKELQQKVYPQPEILDEKVTTKLNEQESRFSTFGDRNKSIPSQKRSMDIPREQKPVTINDIMKSEVQISAGALDKSRNSSRIGVVSNTALENPPWSRNEEIVEDRIQEPLAQSYGRVYQPMPQPQHSHGETYGHYEENPRVSVAQEPVSTFSFDVDGGSFANARRFLTQGSLPPPESVRIEEYINYFKYNYKTPTDGPFALNYEIAPSPLEKDRYLLQVGVKARESADVGEKGWNLVFLIDVSGSMQPANRLPLLKQVFRVLVQNMRPQDRVGIVTYANGSQVVLESASGAEKERILSTIEGLQAGGGTNGSAGIQAAYQMAERYKIRGAVNRVILASDGDFNVGNYSFDGLMNLIDEKRRTGITLTTLGFGDGNYNEKNMEQLANKGDGNYFFIDSFREGRKVFETDLFSNMEVVAKDVKMQVEFNPAHVAYYRQIGFDNRQLNRQDFANDAVDAGEVGAGHTVTALYEVILVGSPLAKQLDSDFRYQKVAKPTDGVVPEEVSGEFAFLKIRYKEPEETQSKLIQFPMLTKEVRKEADTTTDDFRFASAVSYFGHMLRKSQFLGSYGVNEILTLARGAKGGDRDGLRTEFIRLVEDTQTLLGGRQIGTPNENRYQIME